MSRLLKGLSSIINGNTGRASPRERPADDAADAGPSTTPLFPLNGSDADAPAAPGGALVPLAAQPAAPKSARRSASSRALNAVVRATTQVAVPSHIEPTPSPKVTRPAHHSTVVLTETERQRLRVMQAQIKLAGLGLYDGPIDGVMNHELIDGVRHFQTLKGMRDSGMLTTGTLTALGIHPVD